MIKPLLAFAVLAMSEVITGCKNVSVKLELDGAGAVIGKRSNFDLKLTKE